jgi:hypothetical protein
MFLLSCEFLHLSALHRYSVESLTRGQRQENITCTGEQKGIAAQDIRKSAKFLQAPIVYRLIAARRMGAVSLREEHLSYSAYVPSHISERAQYHRDRNVLPRMAALL